MPLPPSPRRPDPPFAERHRLLAPVGRALLLVVLWLSGVRGGHAQVLTITPSSPSYSAQGGTMSFAVTGAFPSSVASAGLAIGTVPPGWTFDSVSGANPPDVVPAAGAAGRWEFAYVDASASGGRISFTINGRYQAGLAGYQTFGDVTGVFRPVAVRVPFAAVQLGPPADAPSSTTTTLGPRLVNVSSRSRTGTSTDSLIAGFVVSGSAPKPVLLRAIGPTLSGFGVSGVLPAVHCDLYAAAATAPMLSLDDWGGDQGVAAAATSVGAFPLPVGSHDAAALATLAPGAYTAVVTGQAGASGVALVEVYDASPGDSAVDRRLLNLATRATAGSGDNVLTAGFVINGSAPLRVLVRGVGPALAKFGVASPLAHPQLVVLDSHRAVIAQNTGWSTSADAPLISDAANRVGAFALPDGSADSAVVVSLPPGLYTAQVAAADGTPGPALVEVYEVPQP